MAKHKQSKIHKKYKQTPPPVTTHNRYDVLSDNESTSTDEDRMHQEPTEEDLGAAKTSKITPKTTKIPPLVVNTTTLKQEHKNELINNIRNLKLNIRIKYSSDNITIFTPTKQKQKQNKSKNY